MYRLTTAHFITDRQTYDSIMPSANYTAYVYDRYSASEAKSKFR